MTGKELGVVLKSFRLRHGYTQEALAFEMGISAGAYYKLESGKTVINLNHLNKLSEIYNIHIASFFIDPKYASELGYDKVDNLLQHIENIVSEIPLKYEHK